MRNFIKIAVSLLFILLIFQVIVKAATATATLKADKTELKTGDTVVITLSAKSEDGLNGIEIDKITYDTEKLELVKFEESENFINLSGSDTKIESIVSELEIKEAIIGKWTFKVRENAIVGATTISTSDILIDTNLLEENSKVNVGSKKVTLDIVDPDKAEPIPEKDTESKEPAPDTGLEDHLFIIIIAVLAVALISYKGYKKFSF